MSKIQNSTEVKSIVNDLKNKNFHKALEKIKLISIYYPDDGIVLKLFASVYFHLMDWENAIKYYEKILAFDNEKFKTYINIGVCLFKLGKINKSITAFKKSIENNPKSHLAYYNLGLSNLEIGLMDQAIQNFVCALRLNEEDLNSQKNLINILNLSKPKNISEHFLIELDNKISKIPFESNMKNLCDEKNIKVILEKSNELIQMYKKNIFLNETQIFRKNSEDLNCKRHFKVFNKFNIIPKYCFSCYKIQINLSNIIDLIKLYFIFDNLNLKNNNTRKCIVEIRDQIKGNYKGYIYCDGLLDAQKTLKIIQAKILNQSFEEYKISIKHGCSEYYRPYPKFEKINFDGDQEINYNKLWQEKENIIDNEEPERLEADKKVYQKSVKGINLSDILIINNWLNYAKIIGDISYKKIYGKKIKTSNLNNILEKQLKFRINNIRF